jgi:hypothetical protein
VELADTQPYADGIPCTESFLPSGQSCCNQTLVESNKSEVVLSQCLINLLKPSGNFTYDQV